MDVGASTGGFTDCLLQNGARKVYAVDVGYGGLAWKLRKDPRVIVLERQNIRYLPKDLVPDPIDLITIDVIFISLKLVLPAVKKFLGSNARLIALIKPNFEVAPKFVGKKGVVKDAQLHTQVVQMIQSAGEKEGWCCIGVEPSPILGAEGNKEFLILFQSHSML